MSQKSSQLLLITSPKSGQLLCCSLYPLSVVNRVSPKYASSAFNIFQEVVFCLALYTEEVNLQFLSWFNAKPFVVTTDAQIFLFNSLVKNQIFSLFPIVKMNANCAEIGKKYKLEADFQQVPFVQIFWNVVKHQ